MIGTSTTTNPQARIREFGFGHRRRSSIRELLAAIGLIAVSTAATMCLSSGALCPLELAPDEAHYWDWSRHLDWSYYSKGPLVAWLIRASCELFGPLSLELTGSLAAAVRLPAVALSRGHARGVVRPRRGRLSLAAIWAGSRGAARRSCPWCASAR